MLCDRSFGLDDDWNSDQLELLSRYKFYLALESNRCDDYITEKFFRALKTKSVIPIVRGTSKG